MGFRVHVLICCALAFIVVGSQARASSHDEGSLELMLFEEIPTVFTATRTERSARDVPNAVTVIGAREIRESGATSLEQLLKTVPGLDFMRIGASDLNVASRGRVTASASSLLPMIDGRSVYLDFFGITLWEQLNVTLQDIERIEVVRGPGSALYGANAFSGIVNIITKRPRDLERSYARAGVGPGTGLFTATGATRSGRLAAKASVQYRRLDQFRNTRDTAANASRNRHDTGLRSRMVNAALDYTTLAGSDLRLSAGRSLMVGSLLTGIGTYDYDGPITYVKADLQRGPWRAQTFYTRTSLELATVITSGPDTPGTAKLFTSVFDLDLQRNIAWEKHEILAGLNVRRVLTDSRAVFGSSEEETLYSGFLQDVYPLTDDLTGFLSVRFDDHPKSGFQASPRLGLVYKVGEHGRVRGSIARSFQNPTHINNYSSYAASPYIQVNGSEDLDPVWLTSYELGLSFDPSPGLRVQADLFFNAYEDFKAFTTISAGLPTVLGFVNQGKLTAWGGEVAMEYRVTPKLRAFGSYSYQSGNGPLELYMPRGKASLGLRGRLYSRLRYALTGSYSGHFEYEPGGLTASALPDLSIPSRVSVEGYLGLELKKGVELGLHGSNLFHQVRHQHPLGDEIGSELMLTLTTEF